LLWHIGKYCLQINLKLFAAIYQPAALATLLNMKNIIKCAVAAVLLIGVAIGMISFSRKSGSHQEMVNLLSQLSKENYNQKNSFCPEVKYAALDSILKAGGLDRNLDVLYSKAELALEVGKEQESVDAYDYLVNHVDYMALNQIMPDVGIAFMRLGERTNCMLNHTGSSCIFPIKGDGVHIQQTGSKKAIDTYQAVLKANPADLQSRWLLNIAYMTLGQYPQNVPKQFLIPGLDADEGQRLKPFVDVAAGLDLNVNGRAGGVIADDFNNDGYIDIVTSGWDLQDPMHYFRNNKNGTFSDMTESSGLTGITGGLNIQQTDYNNDGKLDIFVLRGAWLTNGFGNQPSSLLRNNGDGTFTDVTTEAGLLYFHPTQTATWADFNNDGWLDVFIGAENLPTATEGGEHRCMLYINNQNGTFTNIAAKAHCDVAEFVKGVTSADYDHDGLPDVFLSTMNGNKHLLKNITKPGGMVDFKDVSAEAGLADNRERSFTTWFFDYDNDGWQDIVVSDYNFTTSLGYYSAAAALGKPVPHAGNVFLYHNNHNGKFTDVTVEAGLDKVVFSMGGNFGDIDNDGYPDMYFGTGNPDFKSLVPNKLFRNVGGKRFADVTTSSRLGNLQKGHGIAFADFRNTGIQDIYAEMGGAYKGDSYTSSLYMNPGQSDNNWISLKLEGVKANKAAIGSHIKLTFTENGIKRRVYRDVNSGGSFGSSPLQQEIGIGQATLIDELEITWAGSKTVQRFKNVKPNQFLDIAEGIDFLKPKNLAKLTFKNKKGVAVCMPEMAGMKQ
jgi:hypothetical protein